MKSSNIDWAPWVWLSGAVIAGISLLFAWAYNASPDMVRTLSRATGFFGGVAGLMLWMRRK